MAVPLTKPEALPNFSIGEQIAEVRRTLDEHRLEYPGRAIKGKMRRAEAERSIAVMEQVLRTLSFLQLHRATIHRAIREEEELARTIETGGLDG